MRCAQVLRVDQFVHNTEGILKKYCAYVLIFDFLSLELFKLYISFIFNKGMALAQITGLGVFQWIKKISMFPIFILLTLISVINLVSMPENLRPVVLDHNFKELIYLFI